MRHLCDISASFPDEAKTHRDAGHDASQRKPKTKVKSESAGQEEDESRKRWKVNEEAKVVSLDKGYVVEDVYAEAAAAYAAVYSADEDEAKAAAAAAGDGFPLGAPEVTTLAAADTHAVFEREKNSVAETQDGVSHQ